MARRIAATGSSRASSGSLAPMFAGQRQPARVDIGGEDALSTDAAAMPTANRPIGPQPVISTRRDGQVRGERGVAALPNGSWAAAIAGGSLGSLSQALPAGIERIARSSPARSTPMNMELRQMWVSPVRQG